MVIGIDLDNTIISYDRVFINAAQTLKMPVGGENKIKLRDNLRQMEKGEQLWQKLQKVVYGFRYLEAEIMPGFEEFMSAVKAGGHQIYVVSHKTKYLFGDRKINLQQNMEDYLNKKGLLDKPYNLDGENIFFEESRNLKLERIKKLKCDYFIDDLPEVLTAENFPGKTERILLSDESLPGLPENVAVLKDWYAVKNYFFRK
ncbi:MAG: hypothetical protein UV73_C0005G0066 [Candidatus Gottesmanbacteria bacterium GW2011_GWA2_43_14]|uniref:Haloacid dehalogenase-like hydrolase n=1 Tax=Candidatus Gottesmanbacteria bacterium GW2011_GWA2_43_14 TaxID=1618443 RepID=A0A0G1DJG4_9BACT|nr:MAG: hypothetical protein UV73_C0005G0066 [Candidatus Gottesmanbacteria bacterium GW2011_GWA2_43_14]